MSGVQMTLPATGDTSNVRQAAELIANRPGPENAISAEAIAERVGVSPSTVRNWPKQICEEYLVPVGYCEAGYYRITSEAELARELEKFESQAERARENIRARRRAFNGTTEVTYGEVTTGP